MTEDSLVVVTAIFGDIFRLFTSWYIPGTNVTPAVAMFAFLFIVIFFRVLYRLLGLWGDGN